MRQPIVEQQPLGQTPQRITSKIWILKSIIQPKHYTEIIYELSHIFRITPIHPPIHQFSQQFSKKLTVSQNYMIISSYIGLLEEEQGVIV